MSAKKGRRPESIPTVPGAEVDLTDDLVGRRLLVMRTDDDGFQEEFEGLVDGRMKDSNYLIDFKQSKYLKKKSKDAELNAMEVVDLGERDSWKLIKLKEGEEKERTYGSTLDNPMPKGGCKLGNDVIQHSIQDMVWKRINVMWESGNVFSGFVVRVLSGSKVKVIYDDEDDEDIDLKDTCWRLITKEFESVDQKTLQTFKRKLHRKEYGESPKETGLRRGRSQLDTPVPEQHALSSLPSPEVEETVAVAETDPAPKKRGKRKAPPTPQEQVKKHKEDEQATPQNTNVVGTSSRRGGTGENGRGGGTDSQRATETRAANPEPAYEMLVDDREIKVIKFVGQSETATMYDMVLVLPGISKENVAVECGDFTVRVSVDLRDENNMQNRNNDADGEIKKQGVNGVQLDGNQENQQIKKYCIVLPEHIVPEATTAEVSPIGRLRIKCVAGDSEISDNNC
eukprot:TRINITY_DN1105_c0_g2_i4.p1 TRINITY_DN1105_c0_g2~~TRINITY_DN1105_c0_g2_i4.p1  ORF type:complete len:454 (-),score=98.05 TRINITY_DN1105_c0_g2_i4:205-1566(-)